MDELAIDGGEPVRSDAIVLSKPILGQREADSVAEVLQSGWVTTGDRTAAFESAVADQIERDHGVATTNCSSALEIAYRSLGISGEVITTPITFATTVSGVVRAGGTPVLADVRPDTLTLDPESIKEAVSPETEAIVPVHFAGQAVDMDAILDIAADHDLAVIEDAAHAFGVSYQGTPAGALGDIGCFSFHATKSITTGEGGMLLTDDEALAERARRLRLAGIDKDAWDRNAEKPDWHYDVTEVSGKCNMNDVRAAIGLEQMERLDEFLERRRTVAERLDDGLADVQGIEPLSIRDPEEHARHLYPVQIDEKTIEVTRREFESALNAEGIATGVYYIPIHHHTAFSEIDRVDLQTTEDVVPSTLCLPIHPGLDMDDADDIVRAVEKVLVNL